MVDFNKVVCEYFDITDRETRKGLIGLEEADQNAVLTGLTSKLYDDIVKKITDIDFGTIPDSKGDITKIQNYQVLTESIGTIGGILEQYNQNIEPVTTIVDALENIKSRRDMFEKAYRYDIELPMVMYQTITLSIVAATSFLTATVIEFIKNTGDESFAISIDKTAASKSESYVLFKNLAKFNKACASRDFDKAMDHVISTKVKNLIPVGAGLAIGVIATGIAIGIIFNIVPIMRELIFFFYNTKMKISDYFDIQSDLLEMNAAAVETSSTIDPKKRKAIAKKQSDIATRFRKISNSFEVKCKSADSKSAKDISTSNTKLKLKDVADSMPDSSASSLF